MEIFYLWSIIIWSLNFKTNISSIHSFSYQRLDEIGVYFQSGLSTQLLHHQHSLLELLSWHSGNSRHHRGELSDVKESHWPLSPCLQTSKHIIIEINQPTIVLHFPDDKLSSSCRTYLLILTSLIVSLGIN